MLDQANQNWLREQTLFGALPEEALVAIAQAIQVEQVQANRRLVLEDTLPSDLYILRSGRLEAYRTSPNSLANAVSCLPGTVLYLKELLLDRSAEQTVITLSDCELWRIPRSEFAALVDQYPVINLTFSQQLAEALEQVTSQLAFEQERQIALRPYLVPRVKRGVIGSSRYGVRLRQSIRKASGDRQSVLIFGEPGLGKDNAAALIHFGSRDRQQPMIQLNCDTIQSSGAELFGRAGGKPGLLEALGAGTLMLNNMQDFPAELEDKLIQLLREGTYTPIPRGDDPPPTVRRSPARIILTAERTLPNIERQNVLGHTIRVPPLRIRKADIESHVNYFISLFCRSKQLPKPAVAPEAIRRLQSYDFPGNVTELEGLVTRAILQSDGAPVLTEEIFWSASSKARRFRLNLLNTYPALRQFLRSDWWPDRINTFLVMPSFAIVVAILFLGPQTRDANVGLNLFWAWWWPVMLFLFPFLGRIWCSVCPFMIYGEVVQKLSLWIYPRQLKSWPRQVSDRWGGWILFAGFALILLWEELWDLPNTAYLSAWLLLIITGGAIACSLIFERRYWCRYLCPIGGMNGMFGKLAMIELRAQQGICSATCTTYQCYKGGPQKGEGRETGGCPVYSHPAQLQDNRDCVLCMTCLKACPHRSVELNLRPPGIELWTTHKPTLYEVCLLFLLFGAVLMHRLPELLILLGVDPKIYLDPFALHGGLAILALSLPGLLAWITHGLVQLTPNLKCRPFKELAYGYLPLVLGSNLAHYLHLGLTEAGQLVPVTAATFGATLSAPAVVADPAVILFLQGITLIAAALISMVLTQNISRQPILKLWPQHGAIALFTILLWHLILQ